MAVAVVAGRGWWMTEKQVRNTAVVDEHIDQGHNIDIWSTRDPEVPGQVPTTGLVLVTILRRQR